MTTIQPAEQHVTAANGPTAAPAVAFLGTGRMGGPMAANLARGGLEVRVWNRTAARAAAIAADGAAVAGSPAEAVSGTRVVITMLADGPATEQAATGPDGFLAAAKGAIWVQMGTIGIEWTDRLAGIAAARGVTFVDAPVSGSEGPARTGQLTILASGPDEARDVLAPVFRVLGRATAWLGQAGNGTRAKLVLNTWLADLTETTAETLSFARRLGLDPAGIVDLLADNPLGAPYAVQKARVMLSGDFSPAFALKHALKDAELAVGAARDAGANLALTSALLPRWRDTAASGHADDDLSAVYLTV
ncbi:MAG TPA: NAD(P)-dependent oxidoreductase [Trebonia sp.]|nr:NAD(P)-dependent oxidoreductase [Trebonia sp.]